MWLTKELRERTAVTRNNKGTSHYHSYTRKADIKSMTHMIPLNKVQNQVQLIYGILELRMEIISQAIRRSSEWRWVDAVILQC